MTTTTGTTARTSASARVRSAAVRPVWRAAVPAGVVAAAATVAIAALGRAAGISLDVDGEPIPVAGFATMTLAAVVVGYLLAIALGRWASLPRRAFTVTTLVLTAASLVPDLTFPMATQTRPLLIATHLVAAAIVIPALARRLAPTA